MKLGILGLPNVGKSTLFNALTAAGAECANYPFCTIEPNIGIVPVPDGRPARLAQIIKPEKVTPATIEFVDIAGLVRGASRGEGLGNKFLSHIREVDALVHVVRCFEDSNIAHVEGSIDPLRDIETVNTELLLSDIEVLERRIEKTQKMLKSGEKRYLSELGLYRRVRDNLNAGLPVRAMKFDAEEGHLVGQLFLLTSKPVLYAANIAEYDIESQEANPYFRSISGYAAKEGAEVMSVCAKIEEEISRLDKDEKAEFLKELGLGESGLDKLIVKSYRLLGLLSFFSGNHQEVRAWTIPKGTKAPQAAGKIHSDFEKGFIRAEVVSFGDLDACGTYAAAREKGLVRSEGKDYVIQDGDVVLFRFNV